MTGGDQDFQITSNGLKYDHYNHLDGPLDDTSPGRQYPLNFCSTNSKDLMKNYYDAVLDYIATLPDDVKERVKEVSPTFSTYEETEYPYSEMCGYSYFEIAAFVDFLRNKYGNTSTGLDNLNKKWNPINTWATIPSFSSINPRNYSWDSNIESNWLYKSGRADWIDFRTSLLAGFLSELASYNTTHGNYKFGVQFGSIYDSAIENRGWVDPTKIIECADVVHVADTPGMQYNFDFGADYLRSICKFWSKTTPSKLRTFTTESNSRDIVANELPADKSLAWIKQIDDYNEKGMEAYFICNWEYGHTTISAFAGKSSFSSWKTRLNTLKNTVIPSDPVGNGNTKAVHLGLEYFMYNANNDSLISTDHREYKIQVFAKAQQDYIANATHNWNDDLQKDIITNYMVERNPDYIDNYTDSYAGISFTKTSKYITEKAYLGFMKLHNPGTDKTNKTTEIKFINQTIWSNNGHEEYRYTHGLRNEYNELRSPIHLIWLSRRNETAFRTVCPDAGKTDQFIYWVTNSGSESAGSINREYPGWFVKTNQTTGDYKFDLKIYDAWFSSLQSTYPGGYYHYSNPVSTDNMIKWATTNITGYGDWPYIGTSYSFSKKSEPILTNVLPTEFKLSQNYPNPFNPTTVISYSVPSANIVTIKVYDVLGREVSTLVNGVKEAGNYEVQFDASKLASGLYIYTLKSHNSNISKKMLLLK